MTTIPATNEIPTGQALNVGQFLAALDAGYEMPRAPWAEGEDTGADATFEAPHPSPCRYPASPYCTCS